MKRIISYVNNKISIKIFLIVILILIIVNLLWNLYIRVITNETYNYWKENYIEKVNNNMYRVITPEQNNNTFSEGIGYGMLFSLAENDPKTFKMLWLYGKQYLDENGLMNWKISPSGNIIGFGSASDADQDIAYSLLMASKKWNNTAYFEDAKNMISAIKNKDISNKYVLLPGDKWDKSPPLNPSYISPKYYLEFSDIDNVYWKKVFSANFQILINSMNKKTGLFPDWINNDGTIEKDNTSYGYDAIRVPIRLLDFYKDTKDNESKFILLRSYKFISNSSPLVSGYELSGKPLVKYINTAYISSYSAISSINKYSVFNIKMTVKLIKAKPDSYYGTALKLWVLFIKTNKL